MVNLVRELRILVWCLWLGLFFLPASFFSQSSAAAELAGKPEEIVVVAPDLPQARSFFTSLSALAGEKYRSSFIEIGYFHEANLDAAAYIVALGAESLKVVRERRIAIPVISTYVPESLFYPSVEKPANETALFPIIDPGMQLYLAKILLPFAKTAGILISPDSRLAVAGLKKSAIDNGITLEVAEWNGTGNLIRELNLLMRKSDFILAVEDPVIFNIDTIKNILLTSYRNSKVVIGPNPSYVRAGSLATTWCSENDVANAVFGIVVNYAGKRQLPEPRKLSCSSVMINKQVAKSLSIPVSEKIRDGKLVFEKVTK